MIPPDLAFAQFCNQTAAAYVQNAPAYITYRERTHIPAPSLHREHEIDRYVMVRVKDNVAVMRDLPAGGTHNGPAFPIIPYFDPISAFSFGYFANLKRLDITLERAAPYYFNLPQPDTSVDATVYYLPFWKPSYLPNSNESAPHFSIQPIGQPSRAMYPSELDIDPGTHLPSHIEMRMIDDSMVIGLDYQVLQNHWILTHVTFTSTQSVMMMSFQVVADITYDQITFPQTSPDPSL